LGLVRTGLQPPLYPAKHCKEPSYNPMLRRHPWGVFYWKIESLGAPKPEYWALADFTEPSHLSHDRTFWRDIQTQHCVKQSWWNSD